MAADRVARRRRRASQVLALQPAPAQLAQAPRAGGQGALVDRVGLSGAQAGAWSWPLRGPQLARLSPSRKPVHRSLRLSDRRALVQATARNSTQPTIYTRIRKGLPPDSRTCGGPSVNPKTASSEPRPSVPYPIAPRSSSKIGRLRNLM